MVVEVCETFEQFILIISEVKTHTADPIPLIDKIIEQCKMESSLFGVRHVDRLLLLEPILSPGRKSHILVFKLNIIRLK